MDALGSLKSYWVLGGLKDFSKDSKEILRSDLASWESGKFFKNVNKALDGMKTALEGIWVVPQEIKDTLEE